MSHTAALHHQSDSLNVDPQLDPGCNWDLLPIFPVDDADLDFETMDCQPDGPDVNIVDDDELVLGTPKPAIELIGKSSQILFYTENSLPYVVLHVKTMERFMSISFTIRTQTGDYKQFVLTNNRTNVVISDNIAKLPLSLNDRGWQRICIDIPFFCQRAFNVQHHQTLDITVTGSCRISAIYFQSRIHADPELPSFLKVQAPKEK